MPWALPDAARCAGRLVAAAFDVEPAVFLAERKGPPVNVHARQVMVYLLCVEGGFDQLQVAMEIGRHHSTVGHAVRRVERLRDDEELERGVATLSDMFRWLRDASATLPEAMTRDGDDG